MSVRKRISNKEAIELGKLFNINHKVIPPGVWKYGLEVELEHGSMFGNIANVTKDNLYATAQIAIAHLLEFPDYYQRLRRMEEAGDEYWDRRKKPSIFVKTREKRRRKK